ncbi:hypothetical protein BU23DRAFT_592136 [Bimuria novae-zelandiae CBS 107.79]|uniref:DNA-directed DNA polymerase n=1 Tax=Bimuria novae-zelandiae CBS 107.79 TaxID=1447943 RepID=A0A6A5UWF6_9PLEO|nr:hypothetical protein BU23DRAFT_592136 [Bimuria novae-zelandiae CBS 107.79]
MSDEDSHEKVTYFQQQDLLDISDDEKDFPDPGLLAAERLLANAKAMPPPRTVRRGSSFLGSTPRQRQQEFEAHATRQRSARREDPSLVRSSTAPEPVAKSFPEAVTNTADLQPHAKLKKTASMSDLTSPAKIPFYRRLGETPRDLKLVNAKPAVNIKVEPDQKQLLKEKIVYFFPNNDISAVRRRRIHKVIELGAAWVTSWREDVTHVMFDDASQTYSHLLRHLNRASLPRRVIVVKFDPYIPQCIQYGTLLDHTSNRFIVPGAPLVNKVQAADLSNSQTSLKIKPSRRQLAADSSQKTDSISTEDTPGQNQANDPPSSSDEIVKDSFIQAPTSPIIGPTEQSDAFNDDLSKAIQEIRAIAHLPLDDEEDGDSRPTSSAEQNSEPDTDDEEPNIKPKSTKHTSNTATLNKKKGINQNTFQCMNPMGASSTASNPNARTIEILEQMGKYYDQMQDQWRTLAYRKAVTTLRKQNVKISTAKEAAALPFVGTRLADKIEEIVLTDRLRRLDNTRDDPTDKVFRLFLGVFGAGLVQANKWIQAGHRTLDDLIANAKLTDSQKIGIEHYDDFATRISRAEVKAHGDYVRDALLKIDPDFQVTIMGSYRRGAKDSGDIDIIITKPGATVSTLRDVTFHALIPQLFKAGFLKVKLATSSSHDDGTKWHGVSCLPSSTIWRRLDLLLVPEEEMGAALLYFTGNDIFNRSMRLLASKKGMRFNQRGLYKDIIRGRNREKLNEGTLVEGRDEKKIFDILGVPWREPHERIC